MKTVHASLEKLRIQIVRLPHAMGLELPSYQTVGSVGMDLRAAVRDTCTIPPGQRKAIPTGLSIWVPSGFEAQVRPRSGLAISNGILVLNSPGTIDSDYRGEIMVILGNLGGRDFSFSRGDRIAQLVVSPVVQVSWEEVECLPHSSRASGGFGHTGR